MSEKFTGIMLPGQIGSYAESGTVSIEEMIRIYREHARHELEKAQEILDAKDEDFMIDSYRGIHAQRNRKILQEGRPKK